MPKLRLALAPILASLTLACIATTLAAAHAEHRTPVAGRDVTHLAVHPESNHGAGHGTWAWTPDVGAPVVVAFGPSRAAHKIRSLTVGDVVVLTGEHAGRYTVADHGADVWAQAEGARGSATFALKAAGR